MQCDREGSAGVARNAWQVEGAALRSFIFSHFSTWAIPNNKRCKRFRRWPMKFLPALMHASTASSSVLEKKSGADDIFLDVTPDAVSCLM